MVSAADLARNVHRALAKVRDRDIYSPPDPARIADLIASAENLAEAIVGSAPDHECEFDTYSAEMHSRCHICGQCDGGL